jgi:hypothetical protein
MLVKNVPLCVFGLLYVSNILMILGGGGGGGGALTKI